MHILWHVRAVIRSFSAVRGCAMEYVWLIYLLVVGFNYLRTTTEATCGLGCLLETPRECVTLHLWKLIHIPDLHFRVVPHDIWWTPGINLWPQKKRWTPRHQTAATCGSRSWKKGNPEVISTWQFLVAQPCKSWAPNFGPVAKYQRTTSQKLAPKLYLFQ